MQNVVGQTLVSMAMTFGLGAEIQSPTGLSSTFLACCMTAQVAEKQKCVIDKLFTDLQQETATHDEQLRNITQLYENKHSDYCATVNQLEVCLHFH